MSRLVAFGCSYTYGHGLPDCIKGKYDPGEVSSKFAWPELLAKSLDLECVNISRPGASNFEILDTLLNFNLQKDDLVVVLWTFFSRDMVFEDSAERKYIHINYPPETIKSWVETHGPTDLMLRSWFYMHHANCYLKIRNQDFYFLHVNQHPDFLKLKPSWADSIDILRTNFSRLARNYEKTPDNNHPGVAAHQAVTKLIYAEIKARKLQTDFDINIP